MQLLHLFSESDSEAIPWRHDRHEVINVDIDPRFNAEFCGDILELAYCKLPTADVIWVSPDWSQYARCRSEARLET